MEAFFLPIEAGRAGQRFCIFHRVLNARGAVLYAHPFAEEMNKTRRMAALQSRAFAQAGYAVLQIDLAGCGDSSGDFGEATWERWVEDLLEGAGWLRSRVDAPLWFWGLRAGGLLAVEAARRSDRSANLLLWQPITQGKTVLQQFLRLKLAGTLAGGDPKRVMQALRNDLDAGRSVDVAGYSLNPALAYRLEQATLEPTPNAQHVSWLELSTRDDPTLAPASIACIERWRQAGSTVDARAVAGPPFWQTTEIEEVGALVAASIAAVDAVTGTALQTASSQH